jgi:O-antigen/teichoic acid export membrane protein
MQSKLTNWFHLLFSQIMPGQIGLNAISNLIGRFWSALLSLLSVPIFVRYLGPEAYGLVGLYASFEVVFTFLDFGLSATINREIARNIALYKPVSESKNLLRTFEYIYWTIGFAVAMLITSMSRWLANNWVNVQNLSPQKVELSIYIMGLLFAAHWPRTLYIGVFRGLQKQFLQNQIVAAMAAIRVMTAILLLRYVSQDISVFILWQVISFGIEISFLLFFAWRELNKISQEKPQFDLNMIKGVWKFALSFNLVGVMGMILSQADRLIASKFVNLSDIGYYSVASTPAASLTLVAYSIGVAISPKFSADTARNDSKAVSAGFHRYTNVIHYFVFGFGFVLILFPSEVLYYWTRDWNIVNHTAPLLIFLVAASLLNSLANISYSLLVASGNTAIPLFTNFANCVLFIPSLLVFVPKYGILSAAIIWFLENIISYLVYTLSIQKLFIKDTFLDYLKKDLTPYLIGSFFWFLGGKLLCLIMPNDIIKLAVLVFVTIGYFASTAPHFIREVSLQSRRMIAKNPEKVYCKNINSG